MPTKALSTSAKFSPWSCGLDFVLDCLFAAGLGVLLAINIFLKMKKATESALGASVTSLEEAKTKTAKLVDEIKKKEELEEKYKSDLIDAKEEGKSLKTETSC